MDEVIRAEQLCKSYGNLTALDNVSIRVARGTVMGLLGANGAGKSTAIECLLGTKIPDSGTATVLGMNPRAQRKKLFEHVGVQFQESGYQDKITVGELCEVTASLYSDPAEIPGLLSAFGIADKRKSQVATLSGGERQRLFLVLALLPRPEVVFLDELTTGLDTKARREVWKTVASLKAQGLTLLLTSHFMDEVEALCDRICILKKGRIAFEGTVGEAIASGPFATLEEAYLRYAEEEEMQYESL